ncbi:MAG TPA: methyl-accepting chemotaxis protein, partial [Stellaceae bacterium]|nr:methyl-accepting chemotaxis protein [Stellaceae bacterium]
MNFLSSWSIRAKVTGAFALVLVVAVGLGLFALERLATVNGHAAEIRDNWLPATRDLGTLAALTEQYRVRQAKHIFSTTPEEVARAEEGLRSVLAERDKTWKSYEPTIMPGEERQLVDRYLTAWTTYLRDGDKFLVLLQQSKKDEAERFYDETMFEDFAKVRSSLAEDIQLNAREGAKQATLGAEVYADARLWILGALALAAALCVIAGYFIVSTVSTPILRMTQSMGKLAAHDLSASIEGVGRKDEIGRMASAVQVFKDSMIKADALAAEQRAEQEHKEQRQKAIEGHIAEFDRSVREALDTLASASTELRATATSMSATAEETQRQAGTVASAAEQTSANVQTVAAS